MHDVQITDVADGQALVYDEASGLWINGEGSGGGGLTVSETAPAEPEEGDMWFASAEAKTYVYYDSVWVEMSPAIAGPQGPTGATGATGAAGTNGTNGTNGVDGEANFSSFLLMGA
jgi:hypothetical protein